MKQRMRIAIFTHEFPALSETFVLNQITGLLDRGHDVTVFSNAPRDDGMVHPDVIRYDLETKARYPAMPRNRSLRVAKAPVEVLKLAFSRPRDLAKCLNIRRFGRAASSGRLLYWGSMLAPERPFDAILAHFGPVGQFASALRDAGLIAGPIATAMHGVDVSAYTTRDKDAYADLFERGERFLPISENWSHKLKSLGCPQDKITVHHMGVDTSRYAYRPRHRRHEEPLRLLIVGRLVEKKGVADALTAVAEAVASGLNIGMTVIGDGPLRTELLSQRDTLGLASRVEFKGGQNQESIAAAMQEADILLAPSVTTESGDQEGIPVTIMEAMASGMIVVSTRHSGIPELVDDGKTGILLEERDNAALAQALRDLAGRDADSWPDFSKAARAKVETEFDISVLNIGLEETLARLAKPAAVAA